MKRSYTRTINSLFAITVGLAAACLPAAAQEYPSRPIRLVLPTGPGSQPDVLGRHLIQRLNEKNGWVITADNRLGASGGVAAQTVASAPPDGYTVLMGVMSLTILPVTQKNLAYDLQRDLIPVARIGDIYSMVVASTTIPATNLAELIAWSKANPGKLTWGTVGSGSTTHLTLELLKLRTGLNAVQIPYKESPAIAIDLTAGRVLVGAGTVSEFVNHIKAGTVRGIVVTASGRSELHPNVQTAIEATGNPELNMASWYGFFLPAKTPQPIVDRLERELLALTKEPQTQGALNKLGIVPVSENSAEFRKKIDFDLKRWGNLVREANLKFD